MKIILSRKGFDSKYGGCASPILEEGQPIISLPIPKKPGYRYSEIKTPQGNTYYGFMKEHLKTPCELRRENCRFDLTPETTCHLDPDLRKATIKREPGWRGIFGQSGKPQRHLQNQKVKEDDLFLFFGWFRDYTKKINVHILWGYLQVGEKKPVKSSSKIPEWAKYHCHVKYSNDVKDEKNNAIYIARETLSWNNKTKGYGIFWFNKNLILTKKGDKCRSHWDLPSFFQNATISHHNCKSWTGSYFQSATLL